MNVIPRADARRAFDRVRLCHGPHDQQGLPIGWRIALWTAIMSSVLTALLLVAALVVFGMESGAAWAFAVGVSTYATLFTLAIGGLVWSVTNNRSDRPERC